MEKRERVSKTILILFLLFLFWSLSQFLAPLFLPSGSVQHLSGSTAVLDNEHLIENMSFPWNMIYAAGDRLCHQKESRSFFVNGNQMPFCARCTAIWAGLALGVGLMSYYKIQLNKWFIFLLLLSFFPMAVDGLGQLIGFWESTNVIRFITGMLAGFTTGIAVGLIIDEFTELKK